MAISGAPAALHGYRVQALYTLFRVLTATGSDLRFQLEGVEDLDILDERDRIVETVQVKKYSPLQLSDFEPSGLTAKQTTFFRRALTSIASTSISNTTLVNFGPIGDELASAWRHEGPQRESIVRKLLDRGYTTIEIDSLLTNVKLISVDESSIERVILERLSGLQVGIDAENANSILLHWVYLAMENRWRLNFLQVLDKINAIGKFLSERHAYHEQWYTTITPIEPSLNFEPNFDLLYRQFYGGSHTTFDHIEANLDIAREEKFAAIKIAFSRSNVVILHGASGQGKTTLALRYVHDTYSPTCRYLIKRIENLQHALSIAVALNGFAHNLGLPILVLIDVNPRDNEWVELVRQLAQNRFLHILVAVREEDYKRANIASADFTFEEVALNFDIDEARLLYSRAQPVIRQSRFLDFNEAWSAFGGKGPLLEFVYLLSQTETLRKRLGSQVHRLRELVRSEQLHPDELKLLRLVAVASAYEAKVRTRNLSKALNVPDLASTLHFYEEEYLIRLDRHGYLDGLHAIRSAILVDLLTSDDIDTWADAAQEVLPLILESDLEQFILYAGAYRPSDFPALKQAILELRLTSWQGTAGVLRSLLWSDLSTYVDSSSQAIHEARELVGAAWIFVTLIQWPNDDLPTIESIWETKPFSNLVDEGKRKRIAEIQGMLASQETALGTAEKWLKTASISLSSPLDAANWSSLAFVIYWASIFKIKRFVLPTINPDVPINVLADVVYAVYKYSQEAYFDWRASNITWLTQLLADKLSILHLQTDNMRLSIHYLVPYDEVMQSGKSDPLHAASKERLQLLRQIYPEYETYGIKGYGFKLGEALPLDLDSTAKPTVAHRNIVPPLARWANRVTMGISRFMFRPNDWQEYVDEIVIRRRAILQCVGLLIKGVEIYISQRRPVNVYDYFANTEPWNLGQNLLGDIPYLPKSAVDMWGFATETTTEDYRTLASHEPKVSQPSALANEKYRSLIDLQAKYFSYMRNFFEQSRHVAIVNFILVKEESPTRRLESESMIKESPIRTDVKHLSTHNFWDALQLLERYQICFRDFFGHMFGDELTALEEEERSSLSNAWILWHHFAHNPSRTIKRSVAQTVSRLAEKEFEVINRWIDGDLIHCNSDQVKMSRLGTTSSWSGETALVLQLNTLDPTNLLKVFEQLLTSLHQHFHSLSFHDLKQYLFRQHYERIIIVPTFCGRMVDNHVWNLSSLSTVLSTQPLTEKGWAVFQMMAAPSEWLKPLCLGTWTQPRIRAANSLFITFVQLMISSAQIQELCVLSAVNINDEALDLLKSFLDKKGTVLTSLLKEFVDHYVFLTGILNELPDDELKHRTLLHDSIAGLNDLGARALPKGYRSGKVELSMDEINQYASALANAFPVALDVKLVIIADELISAVEVA